MFSSILMCKYDANTHAHTHICVCDIIPLYRSHANGRWLRPPISQNKELLTANCGQFY